MEAALEGLVAALESTPDVACASIGCTALRWKRQRVLYEWNATSVEYPPREKCIHELFEEQVSKTPDAVAVVFEDEALSYGELEPSSEPVGTLPKRVGE